MGGRRIDALRVNLGRKLKLNFMEPRFPYFLLLFVVCFVIHVIFASAGWKNTLCDWHGFRQTQTAITSYYVIKEGFKLNYITPIFGKPWSIPMEFPLYQWIVSTVVLTTGINLDQAGRLMTLIFFYLSLIPVYHLLGLFLANKSHKLVFLCLILASPYYIFWSRTFMIESLALFLALVFLVLFVKTLIKPRLPTLIMASITGTLAALTKITTFTVFVLPAFLFLIWACFHRNHQVDSSPKVLIRKIVYSFIIIGFTLMVAVLWTRFADKQKLLNPMTADFITSSALRTWNFGTIAQRLSPAVWLGILRFTGAEILGSGAILREEGLFACVVIVSVCIYALFVNRRFAKYVLLCFLNFLWGPFVFINLYTVHDYYFFANGVFLLLAFGFVIVSFFQKDSRLFAIKFLCMLVWLSVMYYSYFISLYYQLQRNNNLLLQPLAQAVDLHTKQEDVVLIYGFDWSSELPYYSRRRALMDRWELPFESYKFQSSLKALGDDKITAMVVAGKKRKSKYFVQQRLSELNLSPQPIFQNQFADLYIAKNALNK